MQAVYKLLTLNKNAADSIYERLLRLKGMECIVRKPVKDAQPFRQHEVGKYGSIFGWEDKIEHDPDEARPTKLLMFNLFKEGYAGGNDFDSFGGDSFVLTRAKETLPLGTIIEVNFYGPKMYFKVDDHRNLTPTVVEQLFIKNILVPAT